MKRNIFLCLAFLTLTISACKKKDEASPQPPLVNSKSIEVNAAAKAEMTILYTALRPTGLTTGVVATTVNSFLSEHVTSPYTYKYADLRSGDKVFVQVICPSNDGLKVTVKIDGITQPTESAVEANGDVPAQLTWQFIVK